MPLPSLRLPGQAHRTRAGAWRALLPGLLTLPAAAAAGPVDEPPCLVIAHRGASGYRPEHTLEAYRLAIEQGADYIEPDLVMTRDGALIARHENRLSPSTDVAGRREFARRWTERSVDGQSSGDWFAEDFTLAEIRQLRAREPLPALRPASRALDGQFGIPTFDEIVALVREMEASIGRRIGLYPELKHAAHFKGHGLDIAAAFVKAVHRHGLEQPGSRLFVQSFEPDTLRRLAALLPLRYVQLLGGGSSQTRLPDLDAATLREIARYATGIGVPKQMLLGPGGEATGSAGGRALVERAHAAGVLVHAWTLRQEPVFVLEQFRRSAAAGAGIHHELDALLALGVDGFFIDQPDIGRLACSRATGSSVTP
jgi:glycerophosphoryl diester phosphodiesterase